MNYTVIWTPDAEAVVHTHSHYSTVVSTFKHCLPPILTETALVLGPRVPVTRYGETSAAVPAALTGYIKGRDGYDYSHHGRADNRSADFVPDEVVERFCLLGPPAAQLERLAGLRELGVDQFAIYAMHDAREATIEAYGAEVIPRLG